MSLSRRNSAISLERAAVVLSIDTEQIWGHLDLLDQHLFAERYPNAVAAYERLLRTLCSAGVSATWLVVGGLALRGSEGPHDARMFGLPRRWTSHVPAGNEVTYPLWYRRSFIQRLAKARPAQDIGLHGGLTHLIWSDRDATPEVIRCELEAGLVALGELGIRPRSFSFPRNQERHHYLLAEHAFSCYRGRTPVLSEKLGRSLPGAVARVLEEISRFTPPPVWPVEAVPRLWNIPASLFLYPVSNSRARLVPLATRLERVRRGVEAAIRSRGVFHFCLHPVNLAESTKGFPLFQEILEEVTRARDLGDIEILTMTGLAERMAPQPVPLVASAVIRKDQAVELTLARMQAVDTIKTRIGP